MALSDAINTALLIAAIIGIGLTWLQVRASGRTSRAGFLRDLYGTMATDEAMGNAFYSIEYERFSYHPGFHESREERELDRLLEFFDLVCELYYRNILTREEIQFFDYRFRMVAANPGVAEYLDFLTNFYRSRQATTEPFASFVRYARREKLGLPEPGQNHDHGAIAIEVRSR
jgi:hypothetical protein